MKVALITGGSRGIGAECVKKFARENYTVILNYNNSKTQAQQLQQQLLCQGCDVHLYQADVSDERQVVEMLAWIKKYFKHLDVLVNNAGVWRGGLVQDVTLDDCNLVMDVNAKGTFLCCKHAIELLRKGTNPTIVNMSSIWGLQGASCESVYAMSKFAVVGLTKSLAEELDGMVNVNCICPPIVLTEMCAGYTEEEKQAFCLQHNTKCYLPSEVACDIFHLATCGQSGIIFQV
ncbi:MAG: SDR family oxidoreductase [Clostridia bacterium]|nr:SDR family oxidoreductase [Clostridia bacterium]